MMVAFCRAVTPLVISMARVNKPMAMAQNTLNQRGESCSILPNFVVKLPNTNAPESAEVT